MTTYQALSYGEKWRVTGLVAKGQAPHDPRMAATAVELAQRYQRKGRDKATLHRFLANRTNPRRRDPRNPRGDQWRRPDDERNGAHRVDEYRAIYLQPNTSTKERSPIPGGVEASFAREKLTLGLLS